MRIILYDYLIKWMWAMRLAQLKSVCQTWMTPRISRTVVMASSCDISRFIMKLNRLVKMSRVYFLLITLIRLSLLNYSSTFILLQNMIFIIMEFLENIKNCYYLRTIKKQTFVNIINIYIIDKTNITDKYIISQLTIIIFIIYKTIE